MSATVLNPGEVRIVGLDELPETVRSIPENLDPLAEGVLMAHQKDWIADTSDLKLMEKGRRTGITWAEAQDDTIIAASSRKAGGDNVFYIGDTKDKGLEFIGYCAHFARFMGQSMVSEGIEEFLFEDKKEDGDSKYITAYRIKFSSGFRITALASRPANIRGLQGIVVIDEAAFHAAVKAVIDACNALLIWGGKIRIISSHNSVLNAFNELVKETREGKWPHSLHRVTFDDAVDNGLYERVCLIKGWTPSEKGKKDWYDLVRASYGTRKDAMREELDAVPKEGEGAMLPLAWIEACSTQKYVVVRWVPPADDFVDWPEAVRRRSMRDWLADYVGPHLDALPEAFRHSFGEDFGMRVDRSSIVVGYVDQTLIRHVPLIVEFRQCPYDQQEQALFHIGARLPRFGHGILDANGNGMVLAQKARQKFGAERITELMPSDAWLREFSTKFRAAFEDRGILLPADADVSGDLKQFQIINGVGKIPSNVRKVGTDGGKRHGDIAVAILNFYAATCADVYEYDSLSTGQPRESLGAFDESGGKKNTAILTGRGFGTVAGRGIDFGGY